MNKRDDVQKEALDIAIKNKRCGLGISMGVGKTLIGLKYIDHFRQNNMYLRVLVVAPKLSIFESWRSDGLKFGLSGGNIEFISYLSLHKKNPQDYDIVILDECHSLLISHVTFLTSFKGRILGLTGTPPRHSNSDRARIVTTFCPIMYKYITDDAVEDKILNDYRIIVHKMSLSSVNNIVVQSKDGHKIFYTSEQKDYDYWTKRLANASSKSEEQICSIMRMKSLMKFKTKENYAKDLLQEIEDKCIVFCNTQEQADRVCKYSVHSGNPDSDANLALFKADEIEQLSCVLQLNEGINIPNLRAGIILHAYGNERKSSQRIGRLLRLNPDDTSVIHVFCYRNTIDEKWTSEALKDLDQTKIKYHENEN